MRECVLFQNINNVKGIICKLLPRKGFARSVSILAGGTALSQVLMLLSAPLLTRLYSPEDFGLLAVYASLLMLTGVIASLRYQLAIPLPETEKEAAHVLVLGLLVVLGMTAISLILVGVFRVRMAVWLNAPAMVNYLWLLPPGLLVLGAYNIFQSWAMRAKVFSAVASAKFIQTTTMVAIQLGAALLGPLALLLGQFSGQAVASASLGTRTFRKSWPLFRATRWCDLRRAAGRYWRFPVFSTWTGLCYSGSVQLLPLMLAALLNAKVVGVYALAHRVLSIPISFLSQAVTNVFYVEAAEARRKNLLGNLVLKVHRQLTAGALPAAVLCMVSAPYVFTLVFGEAWHQAGKMAQLMTPWLYFRFVASPYNRLYPLLDRHRSELLFQFGLFLSSIGSILIGIFVCRNCMAAIAILSAVNSLIYLSRLLYSFRLAGVSPWLILQHIRQQLVPTLLMVAPFILAESLRYLVDGSPVYTWIGFLVSCSLLIQRLWQLSRKVYQ